MKSTARSNSSRFRGFALRRSEVAAAEWISPHIRRVTLAGEAISELLPERACQQLSVEGGAPWPLGGRVYSICNVDRRALTLDLIADVHGKGPGSARFANARVGETWRVWGPGGGLRMNLRLSHRVLVGDPSALGTLHSLVESRSGHDVISGFYEHYRAGDEGAASALNLPLKAIRREGSGSEAVIEAALAHHEELQRDKVSAEWILVGRLQTIQQLRDALNAQGVDNRNIRMKNHWSERR